VNVMYGHYLEVRIDTVLARCDDGPSLFVGHDPDGKSWVVAAHRPAPDGRPVWLCARASRKAIACLLAGRTDPASLIRHPYDGTVTVVSSGDDRTLLASQVPDLPLPTLAVR